MVLNSWQLFSMPFRVSVKEGLLRITSTEAVPDRTKKTHFISRKIKRNFTVTCPVALLPQVDIENVGRENTPQCLKRNAAQKFSRVEHFFSYECKDIILQMFLPLVVMFSVLFSFKLAQLGK